MKRIRRLIPAVMLLITLLVTIAMVLLPELSSQTMRMEAFGWDVQVRQGFFILSVLALLWLLYLLRLAIRLLLAGQLRLLTGWRTGRMNRREQKLQEALLQYLDAEGDLGQQALKKGSESIPEWLAEAGEWLMRAPDELPLPLESMDNPLSIVLAARRATDPAQQVHHDAHSRRLHLQAWLKQRPQSLLAQFRLAKMELAEGNHALAAGMLEGLLKKDLALQEVLQRTGDQGDCRSLLAKAWLGVINEDESKRKPLLRKLRNLAPDDGEVILKAGELLRQQQGDRAVKTMWLEFLKKHDDLAVANACFALLRKEAMTNFRELERDHGSPAFQWLKARLAHACGLDGLAEEIMSPLLLAEKRPAFLRTRAQWLQEKGECDKACEWLQQALEASATSCS